MIELLIMIPALLFMAGLLAIAVTFAESDDGSTVLASMLRAERDGMKSLDQSALEHLNPAP